MSDNENYSEEILLQIYGDIVGTDYSYLALSPSSCGSPSMCGKYSNECDSYCNCKC